MSGADDMWMQLLVPIECENQCGTTMQRGHRAYIVSATDMRWVCEPCYKELSITRRANEIAATMPDEFPVGYARHVAETEWEQQ